MPDQQKRIANLREKRAAAKRAAKDEIDALKAKVKNAEREQLAAIDKKIRNAESSLRGQARRDDKARKFLIGAALLSDAMSDPYLRKWLAGRFSAHLTRERERALFGLDPSSNDDQPLPDFSPKTLRDGSWGAEFTGDTSSLPLVLVGRRIRVSPKRVMAWTATVTEVLKFDADHVLVRRSDNPK